MAATITLNELVELVTETELDEPDERALTLALADFLACVAATPPPAVSVRVRVRAPARGLDEVVADLAVRSCLADRDDLDWRGSVHPGSIVWPVALALAADRQVGGSALLAAAAAGYRATTALAQLLGPAHAARYHPTAVAGTFGAAVTAGLLLGLGQHELVAAGAHAISAAGGLGQAALERSRSMVFHRVAATSTGMQAARFAAHGFSGSRHILDGPRGAIAVLGGGTATVPSPSLTALGVAPSGISVRIFPVNGFVQAVVALAAAAGAQARSQGGGEIEVEIAEGIVPAVSGEHGGRWWDIRSAVAAAYCSGDPFELSMTPDALALRDRITVRAAKIPAGYGRLRVVGMTSSDRPLEAATNGVGSTPEQAKAASTPPPGFDIGSETTRALLATKWARMLGDPNAHERLLRDATMVLSEGGGRVHQALT